MERFIVKKIGFRFGVWDCLQEVFCGFGPEPVDVELSFGMAERFGEGASNFEDYDWDTLAQEIKFQGDLIRLGFWPY